jgi:putative oxidoreductase
MNSVLATAYSQNTDMDLVLLAVRLFLGPMIFAHGFQKYFRGGRIAGTAGWFESIGMKPGRLNAYAAATTELGAGILMSLGLATPLASAGLIALMVVAISTVHRSNGFFNFNKGQGVEYNVGVIVMALVPSTLGAGRFSLDHLWHPYHWTSTTGLVVALALGVGGGALQLAVFYRPTLKKIGS